MKLEVDRVGWISSMLTLSTCSNSSLSNSSLSNSSLSNTSLNNTSLSNTSLSNTSLSNTSLSNTSLNNTSCSNTSCSNSGLYFLCVFPVVLSYLMLWVDCLNPLYDTVKVARNSFLLYFSFSSGTQGIGQSLLYCCLYSLFKVIIISSE